MNGTEAVLAELGADMRNVRDDCKKLFDLLEKQGERMRKLGERVARLESSRSNNRRVVFGSATVGGGMIFGLIEVVKYLITGG